MIGLRGSSPSLRLGHLGRKGVEVNEQEFAKLVHLVSYFFGRLIFAMNSLIPIKAEFVSPSLQLWRDPVFSSHFVDALLDLPGGYVRGKRLKCQLHRLPIHPSGGIEVATSAASGGLPERLSRAFGNTARRLVNIGRRIHRSQEEEIRFKYIPVDLREVEPMPAAIGCLVNDETNRLKAGIARRGYCGFTSISLDIEIRLNFESDPCAFAVRAVMHQCCHGDLFNCESGIVA